MKTEEDEQLGALLIQAQAGDRSAYDEFLKAAAARLLIYLTRRMEGSEMVSDVLQDSLIAIHRSRHTYLPGRSAGAWLYTICEHRMIDHFRKYRRLEKMEISMPDRFAETFPSPSTDTEDTRVESVNFALSELPENQRSIIKLLKIDGLSVREVSARTGLSESAVKVTAFRGYESIRRALGVLKK